MLTLPVILLWCKAWASHLHVLPHVTPTVHSIASSVWKMTVTHSYKCDGTGTNPPGLSPELMSTVTYTAFLFFPTSAGSGLAFFSKSNFQPRLYGSVHQPVGREPHEG